MITCGDAAGYGDRRPSAKIPLSRLIAAGKRVVFNLDDALVFQTNNKQIAAVSLGTLRYTLKLASAADSAAILDLRSQA